MSDPGIQGSPLIHQLRDACGHIRNTAQERSILSSSYTRHLLGDRGLEINHRAALSQIGPILRREYGTAASRQHDPVRCGQFGNDFPLSLTEPNLAFGVEDARDINTRAAFDFRIGINEGHTEPTSEGFSHSRFARSHRSHEK
jgi:hypothetical protein